MLSATTMGMEQEDNPSPPPALLLHLPRFQRSYPPNSSGR